MVARTKTTKVKPATPKNKTKYYSIHSYPGIDKISRNLLHKGYPPKIKITPRYGWQYIIRTTPTGDRQIKEELSIRFGVDAKTASPHLVQAAAEVDVFVTRHVDCSNLTLENGWPSNVKMTGWRNLSPTEEKIFDDCLAAYNKKQETARKIRAEHRALIRRQEAAYRASQKAETDDELISKAVKILKKRGQKVEISGVPKKVTTPPRKRTPSNARFNRAKENLVTIAQQLETL